MKGDLKSNSNLQTKGIEIYSSNRCIAMIGDVHKNVFTASNKILAFNDEIKKLHAYYTPKKDWCAHQPMTTSTEDTPDRQRIIETMCRLIQNKILF